MKKILSIIFAVIFLSLCFVLPACAREDPPVKYVTFSDDFKIMFCNNKPYSRVKSAEIYLYEEIDADSDEAFIDDSLYYAYALYEAKLSKEQKLTVDNVFVSTMDSIDNEVIFDVEIEYNDGSTLSVTFVRNDFVEEYNKLLNNEIDNYAVDFLWPDGNIVTFDTTDINKQESKEFDFFDYDDSFFVEGSIDGGRLRYNCGEIYYINSDFYYFDFNENREAYNYMYGSSSDMYYDDEPKAIIYKITDPTKVAELQEALEKYYEDDMGFIYNSALQESVSKVFLVILFGVIPFAALIAFVILAIKANKKSYKKIYIAGSIVAVLELATFIVTAIFILK